MTSAWVVPGGELGQAGEVSVRVRPQVINLFVGEAAEAPAAEASATEGPAPTAYAFDRAGRLIGGFREGRHYRRGLDNRVLVKWREPGQGRQRAWLNPDEARSFLLAAYDLAARTAQMCGDPALAPLMGWDWRRLQADAQRFSQIYRPVSILPPDQYLALVLQATEGCSYNRCTFCDFYRDRRFRIKGPAELAGHIASVRDFFGPALALRKSLFLADANALVAPMPRVRAWLDTIERSGLLPGARLYSFIDAFDVPRKSVADWQELAGRGLHRVYIGMESGDDDLLRFLRKPGTSQDVIAAVEGLKQAGVAVSVIAMTGIGGRRYAESHVTRTLAVLNALPLGRGDIVYFSPFIDRAGSEYGRLADEAGVQPLDDEETAGQEAALRAGYRPADLAQPPQLSRYDIREFIY